MIFSQNLISILLSKPDKQADMQLSFLGANPLPKTPDHQKKFVAHQNSDFFILSYALMYLPPTTQDFLKSYGLHAPAIKSMMSGGKYHDK